jgi:Uma2 family endonuclease
MSRRATYDDLLDVPEPLIAEILGGELLTSPRPSAAHAHASTVLSAALLGPFQGGRGGPGGWLILFEPELHLKEDVLVPDLAGWRRERMPSVPDAAAIVLPPDWVCEVVSASTERIDRTRKLPIYAREAVGDAWLVNPLLRTLEVYRRSGEGWFLLATHADAEHPRAEPFDAIELDLPALWGELPPV